MKRLIGAALAIGAITISMMAGDLKVTYNTETKAMAGTQKSTQTHYYSSRYHLVKDENQKTDTLIDYKDFVFYSIDHKKKTIQKITTDDLVKMMKNLSQKVSSENKEANELIARMFGGNPDAAASVKQGGTEVVAGRKCNKWSITVGTITHNFSVDPTLEQPIPQSAIEKGIQLQNAMMMLPDTAKMYEKLAKEMGKVKGVRLKTEMQMKIGPVTTRSLTQAVKIEEGRVPASVFEIPKGYKQEEPLKKALEEASKKKK